MIEIRRVLATVALASASVVAMAACGGGSTSSASGSAATSAPVAAGPSGTAGGPSPTPAFTGGGSARFCSLTRTYSDNLAGLLPKLSDPSQLKPWFETLAGAIKSAADVAPPEIKADVALLSSTFGDLLTALERVNYDFGRLPSDVADRLQSADVQAASSRVSAYSTTVCGTAG
ncbi:MAG: hypothetical protein ABR511_05860 [Acidimicrobiales bacterium]